MNRSTVRNSKINRSTSSINDFTVPDDGINTSWSLIASSSGFKTNEEVAVDDDLCKAEFWDSFSNNFSDEFVVKIASLSIRGELSIWPWEEVEDVEHYKNSWD